jgi:integrase
MATLRKRNGSWQAQIRIAGCPPLSKTFPTKALATHWALEQERSIQWGETPFISPDHKKLQLKDLLRRYQNEVSCKKKGSKQEFYVIRALERSPLGSLPLPKINSKVIADHRDGRLLRVASGTVRRELAVLRHCLEIARREWGITLKGNPVGDITMPRPSLARERRLSGSEMDALLVAARSAKAWYLLPIIQLALETGMRRGELLSLRKSNFDVGQRVVWLPTTKNGRSRHVPLSWRAIQTLDSLPVAGDQFFPVSSVALRQSWDRLVRRVGLQGFRFHDLRHEAISRFFEQGLSVPEVSLISGHRDPRMLFRYTHLRAEDVAKKLNEKPENC